MMTPVDLANKGINDFVASGWNVFCDTDLFAVREHLGRSLRPHECTVEGASKISFFHARTDLRDISFNVSEYGTTDGRVKINIPPSESVFFIQFVLAGQAQFQQQGKTFYLQSGHVAVLNPQDTGRQTSFPGCRHLVVRISRARLEEILEKDLGFSVSSFAFAPDPVSLSGKAGLLANFVENVCHDLNAPTSLYLHPRVIGGIEETICRLLLAAIPHNYSDAYAVEQPHGASPYYVRRVEDFIHAHFSEPITLSDFIAVSGVSGRSLHAGFRRFRDLSPMAYLKRYRLDRARILLRQGATRELLVTDVSLAVGFAHPSKFAQDYRNRFGELPSQTLWTGDVDHHR